MSKTIIFLLALPIVLLKIESFPKLVSLVEINTDSEFPQFGEMEIEGGKYIYMKLGGFKQGHKINLELSFDVGIKSTSNSLTLQYIQSDSLSTTKTFKKLNSKNYIEKQTFYTFYYEIELYEKSEDYNYLLIKLPLIEWSSSGETIPVTFKVKHTIKELSKYGELEIEERNIFFMKLDSFSKGIKINLELFFKFGGTSLFKPLLSIYYLESNTKSVDKSLEYLINKKYTERIDSYTMDYKIKISDNYKYLFLVVENKSDNSQIASCKISHIRVEETEEEEEEEESQNENTTPDNSSKGQGSKIGIIIAIVLAVIVLISIVAFIYIRHRRKQALINMSDVDHL